MKNRSVKSQLKIVTEKTWGKFMIFISGEENFI